MEKNLFIDSNIWLSMYHYSNNDLTQFDQLYDMLGNSIRLFLTTQVIDEVRRNRETKIHDSLKTFVLNFPKFPVFTKGYQEYQDIISTFKECEMKFGNWKNVIEKDINDFKLPADQRIFNVFNNPFIDRIDSNQYFTEARERFEKGNPPGKNGSYGDAINWISLLKNVPDNEDLYFVSADKDFCSVFDLNKFNPFLENEWNDKKRSKIHFYSTLAEFLKANILDINEEKEREKADLIEKLLHSSCFADTHVIIAGLSKCSGWTLNEIKNVCNIALTNSQVYKILSDPDIDEFFRDILSPYTELEDDGTDIYKVKEIVFNKNYYSLI